MVVILFFIGFLCRDFSVLIIGFLGFLFLLSLKWIIFKKLIKIFFVEKLEFYFKVKIIFDYIFCK